MLRLDRIIKPWKESAALNAHINLYGFWNDTTFLTKSGDVGMVLRVTGAPSPSDGFGARAPVPQIWTEPTFIVLVFDLS